LATNYHSIKNAVCQRFSLTDWLILAKKKEQEKEGKYEI